MLPRFIILVAFLLSGCREDGPPRVTAEGFQQTSLDHDKFSLICSDCHEHERLPELDNVEHGFGRECAECHAYDVEDGWKPLDYKHVTDDEREPCLGCHATDRPKRDSHIQDGDCKSCHANPTWFPPNYL